MYVQEREEDREDEQEQEEDSDDEEERVETTFAAPNTTLEVRRVFAISREPTNIPRAGIRRDRPPARADGLDQRQDLPSQRQHEPPHPAHHPVPKTQAASFRRTSSSPISLCR